MADEAEPFIPYAGRDGLTGELAAAVDSYESRMGFLPNALRLYMHRPELLECLIRLNDTVMRDPSSQLDRELKRRIAALCSSLNRSAYCVAHNGNTLASAGDGDSEGWGYTAEDIVALLDPGYEPEDPVGERLLRLRPGGNARSGRCPARDPGSPRRHADPAAGGRARLRRRLLENVQRHPRKPRHSDREPTPGSTNPPFHIILSSPKGHQRQLLTDMVEAALPITQVQPAQLTIHQQHL